MRKPQPNFLDSGIYPWVVVAVMIGAYLATDILDAGGTRTSFAIGALGFASIIVRTAYGWWIVIRLQPQERLSGRETRVWTGLTSTLTRWVSIIVWMIGWLCLLALIVWSLTN